MQELDSILQAATEAWERNLESAKKLEIAAKYAGEEITRLRAALQMVQTMENVEEIHAFVTKTLQYR